MGEPRTFAFPSQPTRRERLTFEQQSGRTFAEFAEIMGDPARHHEFSAMDEAALLFMAVKRVIPDVSLDRVIDEDSWELAAPPSEVADDSPLPPPANG